MRLCSSDKCTGCMACMNICPKDAIEKVKDSEGFLHPVIVSEKCVHCKKCIEVCPQIHNVQVPECEKTVYAAWHKNKYIRKKSTSGGAFTAFACSVLDNEGFVFGAGFDQNKTIIHKCVAEQDNLTELRGSKYVQSDIGLSYRRVKESIKEGRVVLFSGTPCQIAGLYGYLGKRFEGQLYTIDLVCHGVPSPRVYQEYLKYMSEVYQSNIKKVFFREKCPGWYVFGMRIEFDNQKVYQKNTYQDPFCRGFLREYFLRPACHNCLYANTDRIADITLADFWGYSSTNEDNFDDDKGISMIMLNTENGTALFDKSKDSLYYWEKDILEAINGNQALRESFAPSDKREEFWSDYYKLPFNQIIEKYLYPEDMPTWFLDRAKKIKAHKREIRLKKYFGYKNYRRLQKIKKRLKNRY